MRIPVLVSIVVVISGARGFTAEPIDDSQTNRAAAIRLGVSPRTVADFDSDWRFSKGDFPPAAMPAFDDSAWRRLNLPHDWSVEGPFGPEYASGNGYAPGGIGWYRKHFRLDAAATNKIVAIEFDGIYDHSEVWINGHFVGGRPCGYSSFECDLTPHLKFGSRENVVAVRVDHSRFADSRWYTGSGIYRHVRLRITGKLRLAPGGTFVNTKEVRDMPVGIDWAAGTEKVAGTDKLAAIAIQTTVESSEPSAAEFSVQSELIAPDRKSSPSLTTGTVDERIDNRMVNRRLTVLPGNSATVDQVILIGPQFWSPSTPRLYTLRSRLMSGTNVVDETNTRFGIRTIRFDADKGFFLNETPMKIKGVCLHHEAGCLGAAVPEKVWRRRLLTLKGVGVNAIRTSHNPPAPEFLDLCDELGFLVMDEAFDEFTPAKNKWVTGRNNGVAARFGYAEDFEEWSVRDISDMVRRDRNHPSIILWSIGNEIDYANDPFSHPVLGNEYHPENPPAENLVKHARPLIEAVKKLDSTRPVTAALATVAMSDAVGFGEMLDVVGYNYQEQRYPSDHAKFPKRVIVGSENGHLLANWTAVRDNDYVAGQFLWTGIDYLGEANRWPNRGSGAGLLDVCGFKKPLAWFRQSLWSDQPMVYLCASVSGGGGFGLRGRTRGEESWNWPSNATVLVHCYTTCAEVHLTLNGKIVGTKRRADAVQGELTWTVPFEPGLLKAIGRQDDKTVSEYELRTAGPARRIELQSDAKELAAHIRDIGHVEFCVVDADGVRVPNAGNEVTFTLEGPADLLGIENGDLSSPVDYTSKTRKAFRGRGLAIVQSRAVAGKITLTATSPGLDSASVMVEAR
jgi:beta-galactosidase